MRLLNIQNSHFNLSGWLGILFINVFGFIPQSATSGAASGSTSASDVSTPGAVLASYVNKAPASSNNPSPSLQETSKRNLWLPAAAIILFIGFVVTDRWYARKDAASK